MTVELDDGSIKSYWNTKVKKNLAINKTEKKYNHFIKIITHNYGIALSLIVIVGVFQFMTEGMFLGPTNLIKLITQNSYIVILALGMLLVIVSGNLDLSSGAVIGFTGALAAIFIVNLHMNWIFVSLLCICAGALIGGIQGYLIAFYKIPAFIVTLAGMLVCSGLTNILLHGQTLGPFPQGLQRFSSGFVPEIFVYPDLHLTSMIIGTAFACIRLYLKFRMRFKQARLGLKIEPFYFFLIKNFYFFCLIIYFNLVLSSYKGIPNVLVIVMGLILIYSFIANRTVLGRSVYAVGGNSEAARLSGIKTQWINCFVFVNMGALAALAGLIFAAHQNMATVKAGVGFELDAAAACFIGGTAATGGVGKIIGAVIGTCVIGVMNNGMDFMGVNNNYQQIIKGIVLIAAVLLDVIKKNKFSS